MVNAQQQTTQCIRDLDANSPSFHSTLDAATNGGRTSLEFNYDKVNNGQLGSYNPVTHRITVDPTHPKNADQNIMQGVAAFEVHNAATRQDFQHIRSMRLNGGYEQAANERTTSNPDRPPVTGGMLYAQDTEHLEWRNTKQAHQAMTEGAQQGMPVRSIYDDRYTAPAGGQAPWAEFSDYQRSQWNSGHTQLYVTRYANYMAQLGQAGPSTLAQRQSPSPSPSPSFGEPGPEA